MFAFTGPNLMQTAPSFSSVLKDCVVIEGQDFVLRCSVRGTPAPRVTWLLNGECPPVPVPLAHLSSLFPEPYVPRKGRKEKVWELAQLLAGRPSPSALWGFCCQPGREAVRTHFVLMDRLGSEIPAQRRTHSPVPCLVIRLLRDHQ